MHEKLTPAEREVIRTFVRRWRRVQVAFYAAALAFLCYFLYPYVFGKKLSNFLHVAGISLVILLMVNSFVLMMVIVRCPVCQAFPSDDYLRVPGRGFPIQRCAKCGARLAWPPVRGTRFQTPEVVAREWQRRRGVMHGIANTCVGLCGAILALMWINQPMKDQSFLALFAVCFALVLLPIFSMAIFYRCPSCGHQPAASFHTIRGLTVSLDLESCERCGVSLTESPPAP